MSDDEQRRDAARLRDRLAELPPAVAETLRLTYFGHLDSDEISRRTGMTVKQVRVSLRTGLLQLGRLLQSA